MDLYYSALLKLALGFICLIFQINLLGKGNLAPASAMDQVQNYVLGGIIGGVIYSEDITILQFFLVLIIWTILVLSLKFLKSHNKYIKRVIDGKPITLVSNGKIDVAECLRCGIPANDLSFKLRSSGIYEISTIKKAVMEQNGQITIIEYGDESIKYPIIIDGQINEDVLDLINKDILWLEEEIKKEDYQLNQIYLAEYLSGEVNVFPYPDLK
ncbi:DUF421 domain-containing protein [Carnobacterium divergens]|uniref:DUF421 domain-containing protein n=1 Tax=Carnobacterium divergens TaxID=2748 RepID=A0AAW8RH39_CARDV|nr:DUF421 domain-containing protein [Carnobacterium divergens]MDT1959003.1 DUF421 domain-containing protein [Carnobacterium divergens]MDT1974971.1 DUF421 domain-containing protein [Carnobacterium divergens]MDT2012935.1 DUF421 domain-containing protein [Carnobacterium divergens]